MLDPTWHANFFLVHLCAVAVTYLQQMYVVLLLYLATADLSLNCEAW